MENHKGQESQRISKRVNKGVPPERDQAEGYQWSSLNPGANQPDTHPQVNQDESSSSWEGIGDWMQEMMRTPASHEVRNEDALDEVRSTKPSSSRERPSSRCGLSTRSLVSMSISRKSHSVSSSVVRIEKMAAEIEAQEELDKLEEEARSERLNRKKQLVKMKLELKKAALEDLEDSSSEGQRSETKSVISKVSNWMALNPSPQDVKESIPGAFDTQVILPPPEKIQSQQSISESRPLQTDGIPDHSPDAFEVRTTNSSQSNGLDDLVKAMTGVFSQLQQPLVPRQPENSVSTSKFLARQTHAKDLPTFSGTPEEWISFIKSYERSTEVCGFTDDENLSRLRRSLKGDALKTVQSLMNTPSNVKAIISKLEIRFGQPEHIIEAMTSRIRSVQAPREDKLETVIDFGLTVENLVSTMIALECKDHLSNPQLLKELEKKLPITYQVQFREWIDGNSDVKKNLESFSKWLSRKTKIACQLCPPKSAQDSEKNKQDNFRRQDKKQVFATSEASSKEERKAKECSRCKKPGHKVATCKAFAKDNEDARWEFVIHSKLCFCCLQPGHWTNKCPFKKQCGVEGCKGLHHPLLHNNKKQPEKVNAITNAEETAADLGEEQVGHTSKVGKDQTLLKILPVFFKGKNDVPTFAFLDEGAKITVMESDLADELGLKGPITPLCMKWTNEVTRTETDSRQVRVKICGAYRGAKTFEMGGVRTVKNLSLPTQTIDVEALARQWPHLRCADVQSFRNAKPSILIGSDNAHLIVSREVIDGPAECPLLYRTKLGWTVHGRGQGQSQGSAYPIFYCEESDETLHHLVKESFKTESFGVKVREEKPRSREDVRAQVLMEDTTKRVGERWETGLLWKNDEVNLPESKTNAFNRLKSIEKKMDKDEKISKWYVDKIEDYTKKGYVRKLSPEEAAVQTSRTWYLPHFFAFHPHKPDKPRLVFDAAAKSRGTCLNDNLVQGPDLLNPLPSVLFKFREKKFAFTGDIKEMFHQVKMRKEDLPSQRFLWRGLDRDREPDTYEIPVLFFGATSSPSSAIFVKNLNALQFRDEYPEAYLAIVNHHYMDDYLGCSDTETEGERLIAGVIEVYKRGGFNICNWTSSSREILEKIPEELRANEIKELDTGIDLPTGRVLGLWWDHQKDAFTWNLKFHRVKEDILNGRKTPTKRDVLKLVMSLFDPLGFLAHFVIKAKILLQAIWRSEIGWDDEIPNTLQERWQMWIRELQSIVKMEIPRCYSFHFSRSDINQLHVFCDASEEAFSAVAYFRIESEDEVEVAFVAAKTRVAPLKPMSIPRLELQAALMGSRLSKTIIEEHTVKVSKVFFWSDSRTVLSWIRADAKRFKPFVAHRIGEIEEVTDAADWHWIPTKENVSDDATRSSSPSDLTSGSRWLKGPGFLKLPSASWPKEDLDVDEKREIGDDDEVRAAYINAIDVSDEIPLPNIENFSSWTKLVRSTAWMLRIVDHCRNRRHPNPPKQKPSEISPTELMAAEKLWWKKVQMDSFPEDLQRLTNGQQVLKSSRLKLLSPFLDEEGILRLGGRLARSVDIEEASKNPVILDPHHPFTKLLTAYYHVRAGHQGKEMICNELRQRYWILHIGAAVKKAASKCQQCRNVKSQPAIPEMGQLPEARVTGYLSPFTFTGMDYFGPMEVTIGRRHEKRYGVLFTCMTTRAVHLEIAASLTTDSAVMAIRRMAARRGHPKEIFSDNGTNLRGAEKEMRIALQDLDEASIQQQLSSMEITWHFNPPAAPHMGGIWERLVRSVKAALKVTLKERAPKEEVLQTLFAEAEAIVNSRPLTRVSVDPKDPEALTPNHFLIGKSSGRPSPGVFSDDDFCARKQWRIEQRMADQFWIRWKKEYLPTIIRRTKWHERKDPVKVGDVVLLVDDQAPRNLWPLGIVTEVYPGKDKVIRVVEVRTISGIYRRPVSKICVLDVHYE